MQEKLFIVYYLLFITALLTGIVRYKTLDNAMRVLVALLFFTAAFELTVYILLKTERYLAKAIIFHTWAVIELIIISWYFIKLNKPRHHVRLTLLACILLPCIGWLNIEFFQPLMSLNTNMLMLESFCIITMSLLSILVLLKRNANANIFYNAHFWICFLWLLLWSSTFFFWAFIKTLYREGWEYRNAALIVHSMMNLVVYTGINAVLLLYPKLKAIEYR